MSLRWKRRRVEDAATPHRGGGRGRGRGAYRDRRRPPLDRKLEDESGPADLGGSRGAPPKAELSPAPLAVHQAVSRTDSSSDDESPEVVSSKLQLATIPHPSLSQTKASHDCAQPCMPDIDHQALRPPVSLRPRPPRPLHNPFEPRTSLLRNVRPRSLCLVLLLTRRETASSFFRRSGSLSQISLKRFGFSSTITSWRVSSSYPDKHSRGK